MQNPALQLPRHVDPEKFAWAGEFCAYLINEISTYKTRVDCVSWRVQKIPHRCRKDLWHADDRSPFQLESPQSGYSRLSRMDQKCMKFPAVLFSNYCHRCLPLNWPRLSQHALSVSVSHNRCLQLLSKRGRDSATQLRGNCHSHAPLAAASPVDEEKCIQYRGCCCHKHLNSNHSSFSAVSSAPLPMTSWLGALIVVKSAEGKVSL